MGKSLERILHLVLFSVLGFAVSSFEDHNYNVGDLVPLFANKIGPVNNPSETYYYYDLPFCRPEPLIQKKETFGEVLNGDRLTNALYELKFQEGKTRETLCQKKLSVVEVAQIRDAVMNDFYFQMYYDDLPLWGFIGKVEDSWVQSDKGPKFYLFKHVRFDVLYNVNHIIEISAFSDPNDAVDITGDLEIDVQFTYSVTWNSTSVQFENRMDKYSRASSHPVRKQIHWFSFINSIFIIVLLMGFLSVLFVRHISNDIRKCSNGDEEEEKEVGWKYVHGDVFRHPPNLSLFCAVLGTGTQLLTMVCFLFILASVGVLYPYNRGALFTSLVSLYSLSSVVAGYVASSFHCRFAETGWVKSVLLMGILYLGPLFVIFSFLNTVAISYGATAALPFGTIVVILLVYTFVNIPLLALGGVLGYHFKSEYQAPCATKRFAREIPPLAWYRKMPSQMLIGGLLSFSAIILELNCLYESLWGYKLCTLPSILFITFIILITVTAISSIGLTYIQLSAEDHEWWWRSVLCGGSTGIFMFGYSIYFYSRSNMTGFMQLSFFMGYSACICYAFLLMLGTVSFRASLIFVSFIYQAVKSD